MIPGSLEATLVLLRHGESVFIAEDRFQGRAESPLSLLGRRQAALAGSRLSQPLRSPALPIPPGPALEIAHSPLQRATETAAAVAHAFANAGGGIVPLRPDMGLAEIGQGEWEGLPRADVASRYGDMLAAWRHQPTRRLAPGGERLVDVDVRVRSALATVVATLEGAATAAGVRGTSPASPTAGYPGPASPRTPWSVIVGHDGAFKVLLLALFDLPLERFWSFPFGLAAITIIELRAGKPILRVHNWTEHLAPLEGDTHPSEGDEQERP